MYKCCQYLTSPSSFSKHCNTVADLRKYFILLEYHQDRVSEATDKGLGKN